MRRMITIALLSLFTTASFAQVDTLRISSSYTTHIIFATDLTYADLSNNRIVAAKIVEQNKNMLAVKARAPFEETASVSALESNGRMHTWIVLYDPSPESLIIDTRRTEAAPESAPTARLAHRKEVSRGGKADAPLLQDIISRKQGLHHLGCSQYGISVLCENIFAYSDITYIVLSLRNRSGVSYELSDPTFVLESRKKGRRSVVIDRTIFPKSRHGSLSAAPGETGRIALSFDKMTLSKDQVLSVYLYEATGQRNLVLTISADDINRARNSL